MKINRIVFGAALQMVLMLGACSEVDAASAGETVSGAYTAAAETIAAQASPLVIATETLPPPATATLAAFSTATQAPFKTATVGSVSSAVGCNNAAYVSDVTIPDGTVLAPGEAFTKTWRFNNSGSCAWGEDYSIIFVSGSDMNGDTTVIDESVAVGANADVSVDMVAPSTTGTYTGYWELADGDGTAFGQSVYVQIEVSNDAATLTPTATATAGSTGTSTSTPAPTNTATAAPAATSTASPTGTEETEAGGG